MRVLFLSLISLTICFFFTLGTLGLYGPRVFCYILCIPMIIFHVYHKRRFADSYESMNRLLWQGIFSPPVSLRFKHNLNRGFVLIRHLKALLNVF